MCPQTDKIETVGASLKCPSRFIFIERVTFYSIFLSEFVSFVLFQDLQEEKVKQEEKLLAMQKTVNETKSQVCFNVKFG